MITDIVSNIKTKSMQKNGSLIIHGVASSNIKDKDGESITITPNAIKKSVDIFIQKGAPLIFEHGFDIYFKGKVIGQVLALKFEGSESFDLDAPIPEHMIISTVSRVDDPDVIRLILSGEVAELSLRWKATKTPGSVLVDPRRSDLLIYKEIEIVELSVCREGVNPEAKFKVVTDLDLIEQYGLRKRIGDTIDMYGQQAKIKSVAVRDGKPYYELDFDRLKSVYVPLTANPNKVSYGCVMLMYSQDSTKSLTDQIDENDLYIDPEDPTDKGIVRDPHTTLLYGLHSDVSLKQVKTLFNNWSDEEAGESLKSILMGGSYYPEGLEIFSNPEKPYDVLVLEMHNASLHEANRAIKTLPYTSEHPTYVPHTTLAYIKKGIGAKYNGLTIPEELKFTPVDIVYSREGGKIKNSILTRNRLRIKEKRKAKRCLLGIKKQRATLHRTVK